MINAYSIWKKALPFFLNAIFVLPFLILTLLMGLHYLQATAIVGLISNLLLIFVILGRVKFRKSTENIYVLAKTIFDSLYLIGYNAEFFEIRTTAFPICVLQDLLFLFARQASVFAIIAMLVERFLVIMCPEEYENCSNKKRMLRWKIFCLLILGIGFCQIFLGITSYARNDQQQEMQIGLNNSTFFPKCTRIQNGFRRISSFASYTGTFFLPLILFILVNSLIGFKVRYSMATVKFVDKRSTRRNRESSQSASSALAKKYFPMHSAIPFVFPLVFVLLNTSTYAMNFAYPPARVQEYSENVAIMEMKDAADLANLCSFSVNFPLFILVKVAFS